MVERGNKLTFLYFRRQPHQMAEDDKTYCGQGNRDLSNIDYAHLIHVMMQKFALSRQEVLNAIELVGTDKAKLEEFFINRSTLY